MREEIYWPAAKGEKHRYYGVNLFREVLFFCVCAGVLFLGGCSTTKKLTEGQVLYTGVKKMKIETEKGVRLEGPKSSAITGPLSYPPNNPLYSPYVRTPFPIGLWVYNWNIKKKKGFKYWLYKQLAKKPVLISDVQPDLRLKVVDYAAKDYGYFGVKSDYRLIYNKRNPKKAKISYHVYIPKAYVLGDIHLWGWEGRMSRILQNTWGRSLLVKGNEYDLGTLEDERERVATVLRNRGYYYFRPDYIEILADTTQERGVVDIRVALKRGVPQNALRPYKINQVDLILEDSFTGVARDSFYFHGFNIDYTKPLRIKPKIIASSIRLLPGEVYSAARQNRTQANLIRLGIFKYANLAVTPADTLVRDSFGKLDVRITAAYDLPIETEIEVDVSSKSNNLLGPGLILSVTNKNLFRGGENLSFRLNGAYEWQTGKKQGKSTSGLINSYEIGLNADLSVPRLLVPGFMKRERDFAERTHFQLGVDFLNRHTFFRMISFTGAANYNFQSSLRKYHTITPLKINYTYLLRTSSAFDSTMTNNPAIALSFKNQFIPSMSYSYTYDRAATSRNPNRFMWQSTLMSAGNVLSGILFLTGNRQGSGKTIFGNPYSQFLKLTSEIVVYRRMTEKSLLAMRLLGGIGYAYGNSEVMPYSEQFYIGGANSIRAFTIRSIGPGSYHQESRNSTAYLDQTGDIKLEGNIEYRFKIGYRLNGAIFLDAGNVWLLRNDPKRPGGEFKLKGLWKEIALGTGFGLRYDISYIVLRADLGIALHTPYKNPDKHGYYNISKFKDGLAFHLAIGYPF